MNTTATLASHAPVRRRAGATYRLVRQLHLWAGAWGALAAILFGVTGLVMNHRFGDGAWPQGESSETGRLVLEVPASARADPPELSAWLAAEHGLTAQVIRAGNREAGKLGGREVSQPPKWTLSGGTAGNAWSLEFIPGNATADLKRTRHSTLGALNRLHKGYTGGGLWTWLIDSFAVGMVLLGLSGIWMWVRGRSLKETVFSVLGLSGLVFVAMLGLALA